MAEEQSPQQWEANSFTQWHLDAPHYHERRRPYSWGRKWLSAGALTAALAVGAIGGTAAVAHASGSGGGTGATPSSRPSTSSSSTTTPTSPTRPAGPSSPAGHGRLPGRGPHGAGPHGHGPGALTVTQVSGNTITVKRPDGSTETITTTSSTVYTQAGEPASLSDITAGDTIRGQGTLNSNGTITATRIDIVLPSYHGLVVSVNGESIQIQDPTGTHTIDVNSSTSYIRADQSVSRSAVTTGERIGAAGPLASNGVLDAEVIHIDLPSVGGRITNISSSTITVQGRGGSHTIDVSSSTKYVNDQTQAQLALNNLQVGENIHAEGTLNSNGTLDALVVHLAPAPEAGLVPLSGAPARPASAGPTSLGASTGASSRPTPPAGKGPRGARPAPGAAPSQTTPPARSATPAGTSSTSSTTPAP
jgi:hypothetical protein